MTQNLPNTTTHPVSVEEKGYEAYRNAGVDLERGYHIVEKVKSLAPKTYRPNIPLMGIGGFSGAFKLPAGLNSPVLLAACDGVGTKLALALEAGVYRGLGIDLVAMSVNDLLTQGADPLVFLDYMATGRIHPGVLGEVLEGITEGCQKAGCALIGGETAEMPGFYDGNKFDLAGFAMGVVEESAMLPKPEKIQAGDVLIGLASSGLHSNGYSLVRKLLQDQCISLATKIPGEDRPLKELLLEPTRIYVKPVLDLLNTFPHAVKAMAHITGGGFYENIPRALPSGVKALIHRSSWPVTPLYQWLRAVGSLSEKTMMTTFNDGIGFVLVVDAAIAQNCIDHVRAKQPTGMEAYLMGTLQPSQESETAPKSPPLVEVLS